MRKIITTGMAVLALAAGAPGFLSAADQAKHADPTRGPADLVLTFRSPADGTVQPYRLYLPGAYDGKTPVPLLVALHGTGGNHDKYFDHPTYGDGIYKREAEKRGIAILCPAEGDPLGKPTEWRGIGEVHVLAALEDVCRRFKIDPDRVVLTGQSMGGTGTTYLCCRYPDLFAAGIPLASTYGHVSLAVNLRHVPMFYVQGGKDWPVYAQTGPIPLTNELRRLGYDGTFWMIPDAGHNTMAVSTGRVLDWALRQRRVRQPRHVTHRTYLPLHGRAYWTEIRELDRVGGFAELGARVEDANRVVVTLANAKRAVLRPEPPLFDAGAPVEVVVNGRRVFAGSCRADQEIRLTLRDGAWAAAVGPRAVRPRTAYRGHPVGTVVTPPDWEGSAETSLGSWTADALRDATGADVALCTKSHHRGIPLKAGQTADLVDLINWLRPCDSSVASFKLRGAELLAILEDNVGDKAAEHRFLVQVSGCRYSFDRRRPQGQRVVSSDIDPAREYTLVCPSHDLTRTDTMHVAGRDRVPFRHLELTVLTAAWRYIERCGSRIEGKLDGRVTEVSR